MAVKYVKEFEFPSDKGFTGSAGQTMVRGYARGGKVCAKAAGGAVPAERSVRTATPAQQERMTKNAQRAPEDSVRDVRATLGKGEGPISDRERALLARNAKLGLKSGGSVSLKGKRNPQKIGSQEPVIGGKNATKPLVKKGLGGIVKKIGGGLLGGGLLGGPVGALGLGLLGSQLVAKKDKDGNDTSDPMIKTAKDAYAAKGVNAG